MTDPPPIQTGHHKSIFFSGQVRSLTYDAVSKPPHGHKMSQLPNAANGRQFFSGRWNFQKVTDPQVLTFLISRIFHACSLSSGQSRDLAHWPMEEYWNCSFCNIIDIIRTQTNQILLSCTTVMSLCIIIFFYFVTSHVTSEGSFWITNAFVNNFRSNWDRVEKAPLCWQWACESTDMQPDSLDQPMNWGGMTWPLSRGQLWIWLLPNKKYIICLISFDEEIAMVLKFWWNYGPKTKRRPLDHCDHWGYQLTRELEFGYQSLRLITAVVLIFSEALAQLEAKCRAPLPENPCRNCMLKTVTSVEG